MKFILSEIECLMTEKVSLEGKFNESNPSDSPAILIIAFNRPTALKSLLHVLPSNRRIYVHVDGQRNEQDHGPSECLLVVKEFIESSPQTKVQILAQQRNLGCKNSCTQAITWAFKNEEKLIILEDDVVLNSYALQYFDWALERFNSSPEIFQINGYTPTNTFFNRKKLRVYKSLFVQAWGWATWRNRWSTFDVNLSNLAKTREIPAEFHSQFKFPRPFLDFWNERLRRVLEGFDTWDFQWQLYIWQEGGFVIAPDRSLTENIGFDEVATHTRRPPHFISKRRLNSISAIRPFPNFRSDMNIDINYSLIFPNFLEYKVVFKTYRSKSVLVIINFLKRSVGNIVLFRCRNSKI